MSKSLVKSKRLSDNEVRDLIGTIPSLKSIFKKTQSLRSVKTNPKGFMYSSRFDYNDATILNEIESVSSEEKEHHSADIERRIASNDTNPDKVAELITSHSGNYEKKRRYALSLATLAEKSDKRISIVNEGAISILINLSVLHDKIIQVRCASAFASLAKEATIRSRMLDEGALAAVISLASNCNLKEVRLDCCRAICNLCCVKGCEYKMIKEAVPFTVTHIAASCPESYEICLKILLNISCVSDNAFKIARIEDVTEALMMFFNSPLTIEQEKLVLASFCNLSMIRNNQLRLVEDGCFRIVEKFIKSPHLSLRMMSCEILRNLTSDYRARAKLMELNIIGILIDMAKDEVYEINMTCMKSMLFLSRDAQFRVRLLQRNAFSLVVLSGQNHRSIEMSQASAKILRTFCSDPDIAERLVKEGIKKALTSLLKYHDTLIRQYCAESICALYQMGPEIMSQLVNQETVEIILQLAENNNNPITSQWASSALYHLSMSNLCPMPLMQVFVLPCVIALSCSEVATEKTKSYCSAALSCITKLKTIDCTSAIPLLVQMLRLENNQGIKKHCALSLFNLADKDRNCYLMLDSEALLPIVQLTQSEHIKTKVICAGIISRLSLHKTYYHQFAKGDVLKVLLELSSVDHRLTQRRVVIALSNLSHDEGLRSKLLALNPIPYIISLSSERDEYLRRGCISIVCNMSFLPGSEKAIVDAKIVPTLLTTALISTDQIVSKIICVKALINLMADRSLFGIMAEKGVIWGLSKLAEFDNEELLHLCAKALCSLSCDYAKDMIKSSVAVKTVKKLTQSDLLELKKIGARIVINLLLQSDDDDYYFRKSMVENMATLLVIKDHELQEICVLSLCLASQSESCRPVIVSTGVLQFIDGSSIFADSRVSYAYITLFSNIANNPLMRTRVLDDQAISRFSKICESQDHSLDLAIAMAIYCVSCSSENIPKLVGQNVLPFIMMLISKEYKADHSKDILNHLVACLYNLTTHIDVQGKLVSQGFVSMIYNLWNEIEKDIKLCKLAYLSICHLACGHTNTARMIADGSAKILCFITEHRHIQGPVSAYKFPYDLYLRCSAAMRNLLSVISNQKAMVDDGCLDTLIYMASTSFDASKGQGSATQAVHINCAAALKSLTFNQNLREQLVQSEAISIILADLVEDGVEIQMGQGLLKELEAESWSNGARGRMKSTRVKNLQPADLCTDFLRGVSNVQLNVDLKFEILDKFCVQIQLDETEVMDGDSTGGSDTSRSVLDAGESDGNLTPIKKGELGGISGADNRFNVSDEGDDLSAGLMSMAYPKQECELATDYIRTLNYMQSEQFFSSFDESQGNSHDDGPDIAGLIHSISHELTTTDHGSRTSTPSKNDANSNRSNKVNKDPVLLPPLLTNSITSTPRSNHSALLITGNSRQSSLEEASIEGRQSNKLISNVEAFSNNPTKEQQFDQNDNIGKKNLSMTPIEQSYNHADAVDQYSRFNAVEKSPNVPPIPPVTNRNPRQSMQSPYTPNLGVGLLESSLNNKKIKSKLNKSKKINSEAIDRVKTKEELEMENMVLLIKQAKNGTDAGSIDKVMKQWYELSRF